MKLTRRNFDREFKLQVCHEIESGLKSQAQVSREHKIAPNLISRWLKEYREDQVNCFSGNRKYPVDTQASKIRDLEAALGRATYENQILRETNEFLKKVSQERRYIK